MHNKIETEDLLHIKERCLLLVSNDWSHSSMFCRLLLLLYGENSFLLEVPLCMILVVLCG